VYVGPGSRWENPWRWRTRNGLARVPALNGTSWEVEDRISAANYHHPYCHPDGRITSHHVRFMTRAECVEVYRRALTDPTPRLRLWKYGEPPLTLAAAREELAGRDLYCRCALNQQCHADVLLQLANRWRCL
jgi:hypothetical protein